VSRPEGLFIGMEYETREGDFLLFGPVETLDAGLSAVELLEKVEQKGGVAVAEYLVKKGLCRIIESINGRNQDYENARADIVSALKSGRCHPEINDRFRFKKKNLATDTGCCAQ